MTQVTPLPRLSGNQTYRLSSQQTGLWYLSQLSADPASHLVVLPLELKGEVANGRLRDAFQAVLKRHAALRSYFPLDHGQPVVASLPVGRIPLWASELTEELETCLAGKAVSAEGLSLDRGPLIKLTVTPLVGGGTLLTLVAHHIILDGQSAEIVLRDLSEFYTRTPEASTPGRLLPERSYQQYAVEQGAWLAGTAARTAQLYWQRYLDGCQPHWSPPKGIVPKTTGVISVGRVTVPARPQLIAQLKQLARAEGTTLFTILLASFGSFLNRVTGIDDVLVAYPITSRRDGEYLDVVGLMMSTLPCRSRLQGRPTFRDILRRTHQDLLDARDHAGLPFPDIVAGSGAVGSGQHIPLTQVLFVGIEPEPPRSVLGLPAHYHEAAPTLSGYDLTFTYSDGSYGRFVFEHMTSALSAKQTEGLARDYTAFLSAMVDAADRPIGSLAADGRLATPGSTATRKGGPAQPFGTSVLGAFLAQCDEKPNETAVVNANGGTTTYRELRDAMLLLSSGLSAEGFTAGDRIGVAVPPSTDLIALVLATWSIGATYVPLDASIPDSRLRQMLGVSDCTGVIRDDSPKAACAFDQRVLTCAEIRRSSRDSRVLVNRQAESEAHACILFTSGTTGPPKAVPLRHASISAVLQATLERLGSRAQGRWLLLHSPSFDFSLDEILTPLACGGSVCIPPPTARLDSRVLVNCLADSHVTVLCQTPSAVEALAAEVESSLRLRNNASHAREIELSQIILGGEEVTDSTLRALRTITRELDVHILNTYGPTEATMYCFSYDLDLSAEAASHIPIGTPLRHVDAQVLDSDLFPVLPGAVGELYLGGLCLADGYLGDPEATAAAFIDDPSSPGRGKLYRTGDRVFVDPFSRQYVFQGRSDRQVKLRGFRVELDEIERHLESHPGISRAIVAVTGRGPAAHLRAAVVTEPGSAADAAEVRRLAAAGLPPHAVPSVVQVVDRLERDGNGKARLPDWSGPQVTATVNSTPMEQEVLQLVRAAWSTTLNTNVESDANFFDSGGTSLLLVVLRAQLEDKLRRPVSIVDILTYPTVRSFANFLSTRD